MSGGGGLSYDRYRVNGFDEWLVRIGDPAAPAVLILPPLFEEMNRTRAFLLALMRRLAEAGYSSILPDLPGTGESPRRLEECGWDEWQGAVDAVTEQYRPISAIVLRAGSIFSVALDTASICRVAPVSGASILRDLERSNITGGGSGGYAPSPALAEALGAAEPVPAGRTLRLESDPAEADRHFPGSPIWRRSEPENSSELAGLIALDFVKWHRSAAS